MGGPRRPAAAEVSSDDEEEVDDVDGEGSDWETASEDDDVQQVQHAESCFMHISIKQHCLSVQVLPVWFSSASEACHRMWLLLSMHLLLSMQMGWQFLYTVALLLQLWFLTVVSFMLLPGCTGWCRRAGVARMGCEAQPV